MRRFLEAPVVFALVLGIAVGTWGAGCYWAGRVKRETLVADVVTAAYNHLVEECQP